MRGDHRRRAAGALVLAVLLLVVPAAGAEPPAPTHDAGSVRELADEILARDEFQPPEPTLLDRIFDWINEHLVPGDSNGGGSGSAGAGSAGAGGSGILTAVLLVLGVVALGWIGWTILGQPRRRRRKPAEDPVTEIEVHRTAADWARLAVEHESAGRWKDGLRCRFRALVVHLTDEGIVPEVAGRTSGELRGDVRVELPPAAEPFAAAVELFERAWYGDLPTGPGEAARFAGAAEAVTAAAADRRSRPEPEPEPEPVGAP